MAECPPDSCMCTRVRHEFAHQSRMQDDELGLPQMFEGLSARVGFAMLQRIVTLRLSKINDLKRRHSDSVTDRKCLACAPGPRREGACATTRPRDCKIAVVACKGSKVCKQVGDCGVPVSCTLQRFSTYVRMQTTAVCGRASQCMV